jgi:hypothetical protein
MEGDVRQFPHGTIEQSFGAAATRTRTAISIWWTASSSMFDFTRFDDGDIA